MLTSIWEYGTQRGDNVLIQDYLMRMFMQLAAAMKESLLRARGENDPRVAADMLDAAISDATEMDGGLLLCMAPESMAAMLQLSQPDPQLMEYVSRSLLLSSRYSSEAGDSSIAALRRGQAYAVARAFGVDLDESSVSQQALDALFERSGIDPNALGISAPQ